MTIQTNSLAELLKILPGDAAVRGFEEGFTVMNAGGSGQVVMSNDNFQVPDMTDENRSNPTDRSKRSPLASPSANDEELNPGDCVEGLGDFGKPTGEFGTVEQTNEEDALVKWDDDGHYPQRPRFKASLIKVRT
jgi:hypothetical protein